MTHAAGPSVDIEEVERFSRMAADWWNPRGKFAPLHRFNPVRLGFIRDRALASFGRDGGARRPFEGLRLLDIGCGGGLLSEPMARLGFEVTAVDASERNIGAAKAHAAEAGLDIRYLCSTIETLAEEDVTPFDVILNMEVIEHVADPGQFLKDCARMLAPGGLMIVATLNRTAKAMALAVIGAEHVLRWLPVGTHDWKKFVRPEELRGWLQGEHVEVEGPFGVSFSPLTGRWSQSGDADVNYMMTARRG
jgi:2-polyprenyl-6-hydroxyphenyl methylase/3-demethylubiquinone-9 3-methyltransferase